METSHDDPKERIANQPTWAPLCAESELVVCTIDSDSRVNELVPCPGHGPIVDLEGVHAVKELNAKAVQGQADHL